MSQVHFGSSWKIIAGHAMAEEGEVLPPLPPINIQRSTATVCTYGDDVQLQKADGTLVPDYFVLGPVSHKNWINGSDPTPGNELVMEQNEFCLRWKTKKTSQVVAHIHTQTRARARATAHTDTHRWCTPSNA